MKTLLLIALSALFLISFLEGHRAATELRERIRKDPNDRSLGGLIAVVATFGSFMALTFGLALIVFSWIP